MMNLLEASKSFLGPKLRLVLQFLTVQGITVACNLIYGLLCVRLLSTQDYAKFVVVFAVQGTLVMLMDVGISGSLIPLVGERVDDKQLIADYVTSLRMLARRLYLMIAVGLTLFYPYLVRNRGWSWRVVVAMIATLLISTWFMRVGAAYGAVLILMRDRTTWYRGQMISSLGTLALLGIFWTFHWLFAFTAILINVAGIIFVGLFYFNRASHLGGIKGHDSLEKRKAILRLALPNIPGIIFYALQGQISLFLITIFGRTAAVAGVGALGRLGQIFSLFMQMNPLLVEPYFAKLPKERLKKNYLGVLIVVGCFCVSIVAAAYWYPEAFLWVLGAKYSGLRYEVFLVISSSAVSYFTNVLWVMHSSRRFIYWWNNILNIALTIAVQVLFIVKADLGLIRSVLLLNLLTSLVALFTNLLSGVYGFISGPRRVETDDSMFAARLAREVDHA